MNLRFPMFPMNTRFNVGVQNLMENEKNSKIFRKQPILCPWITSQPYHSTVCYKNSTKSPSAAAGAETNLAPSSNSSANNNNPILSQPWIQSDSKPFLRLEYTTHSKTNQRQTSSMGGYSRFQQQNNVIQQSSSHFFYFLRLMQLFPDTHPATIHTVLILCKNDFFCAVDKLLYAKRCRILSYKKNSAQSLATQQNRQQRNQNPNNSQNNSSSFSGSNNNTNNNSADTNATLRQTGTIAPGSNVPSTSGNNMSNATFMATTINCTIEKAEDLSCTKNNMETETSENREENELGSGV